MAQRKVFRIPRDDRPPQPFDLVFEVQEMRKVNVGTEEDPSWIEEPTGEWVDEVKTFHARNKIPGGVVLATAPPGEGDVGGAARQAKGIRDLIKVSVVESESFIEILDSTRTVVDQDVLSEIINWIVEESG